MKKLSLILLLGLSACGGSSNDPPAPVVVAPVPPADAFMTLVATTVSTMPDDSEPVSLDAIVATAPDDAEPMALPAQ
jgi:hypothetical protein